MRLEVVKEKTPRLLYLYGRGVHFSIARNFFNCVWRSNGRPKRFDGLKTLNFSELAKLGRIAPVQTPPADLLQGQGMTFMSELPLPKKDI